MFLTFSNLLFLPILSGFLLLLPLAHFFINFSNPDFPGRWGIYLHYRGYSAAMICYSAIFGYLFLIKKKPNIFGTMTAKNVVAVLFIINAILFDVVLHLPLNVLGKQQFYYKESWIHDDNEVIKHIPPDAYLLTTNNLSPQTAFREKIFYYPQHLEKADYIFVDVHPGQPIVNFWLTAEHENQIKECIAQIVRDKSFAVVYQKNDAILLKRISNHVKYRDCPVTQKKY